MTSKWGKPLGVVFIVVALGAVCVALAPFLVVVVANAFPGDSSAERYARQEARQIGREMTINPVRDATVMDLVRRFTDTGTDTGTGTGTGDSVDVLRATGSPRRGDAVIVLRITKHVDSGAWEPNKESDATLCFEYQIGEYAERPDGIGSEQPLDIACPDTEPIAVPTPTPEPVVTMTMEGDLRSALSALTGPTVESVRTAATGAAPEGVVDMRTDSGWIGVGIRVGSDCLMGRVRDGDVEVWIPPSVVVQPGELTCDGGTAAAGLAKRPPH